MAEQPLVSILMNCFNGEHYLVESLDSVLAQTYENWELIFWDNQSKDQSAEIFKSYDDPRLKYFLALEHTDLGGGRAKAFQHLKGEFIAVLDTDDLWMPKKLEEQLRYFEDVKVGICITNTEFFSQKHSKVIYRESPPVGCVTDELIMNYFVSLETVMLRSSSISCLEYAFDPEFSHIADFDLIVRISTNFKLAYASLVLAKWRVHEASETWTNKKKFILEKKGWLLKNRNKVLFAPHQDALNELWEKNEIEWAKFLLSSGKRNLARQILGKHRSNKFKGNLLYVLSLFPASEYLIRWREQRQRSVWF
jgi:glycosyltransferase involved in cell wall biosynthesis